MMIYVAMVADRHTDTEPYLFSSLVDAIDFARAKAIEGAHRGEDFVEEEIEGWRYYARYSTEGDAVWVTEKILDGEKPI